MSWSLDPLASHPQAPNEDKHGKTAETLAEEGCKSDKKKPKTTELEEIRKILKGGAVAE